MNPRGKRAAGSVLIVIGMTMVVLCEHIVFPGLEVLFGIETIVGKDNVYYAADGSYVFTNPRAMLIWIAGVASIGLLIAATGVGLILLAQKALKDQSKGTP